MKLSNFIGIGLLLFGVAAGVFLVQKVQDYRERAAGPTKHTICHKTGSASNPHVTIEVSENALKAHLDHGDTIGACPEGDNGQGGDSSNGSSNSDNNSNNSSTTSESSPGDTSGSNNESSSGDSQGTTVVTETRYVYLNPGTLEFYIKFLGVDEKREDKSIRVELRDEEDQEVHIYEDVIVSANNDGVYSGTLREVPPGLYEIYIKNINHLQRNFNSVNLQRGLNRWYWNETELLPGDFDNDNDIDINDIARFMSEYDQEEKSVNNENITYDLNFDGKINQDDMQLLLDNYSSLLIEGES